MLSPWLRVDFRCKCEVSTFIPFFFNFINQQLFTCIIKAALIAGYVALSHAQLLGRGEMLIESTVWKILLKTVASDGSDDSL